LLVEVRINGGKNRPQDQKIVRFLLLSILLTSWTTFIMGGYEMYQKNRKGEADSALSHHTQCALTKGDTHINEQEWISIKGKKKK